MSESSDKSELPIFRYHPLHDLEALWWIALYFLVTKDFETPEAEDSDIKQASLASRRKLAKGLFWKGDLRFLAITTGYLTSQLAYLPSSVRHLADFLIKARERLAREYRCIEKDIATITFSVKGDVYEELLCCLDDVVQSCSQDTVIKGDLARGA